MDDATRLFGEMPDGLDAARAELTGLVDQVTHEVLELFSSRAVAIGERIAAAGGDPLEVLTVFVATLRVIAEGLELGTFDVTG